MSTRHLTALDYADYQAHGILKKHAKNRPLGHIEQKHNYIPSQPVLSCRTVDIDLPGTRTYRPKSTVDILDEQQRLIRQLYNKQRAAVSAPPHQRTDPSIRTHTNNTVRSVNIEVKGRPLTSLSHVPSGKADKITNVSQRRPRTTAGRLKNVKPATDSFMVIKVDKDLVETSKNNRQLTNQIHSYWKSENHNLAVGKFVRGQKRPDDVPPTLDAWFTFGGAAGEESQGVIDAFTSFKSSEEYYNIEGSVGSKVAQQLQKGDKIRIGINGVLQTQDLKVKRWKKENAAENANEEQQEENQEPEQEIENTEPVDIVQKIETPPEEPTAADDDDDDFKELKIDDALDELLEEDPVEEEEKEKEKEMASHVSDADKGRESSPRETIPLSWDDQCHKTDVKVIHARPLTSKGKINAMSETHPVKFERLISNGRRPRLCDQPKENGFKVKQRASTLKDKRDGRSSASKIKVVYIDPLNPDQDNQVDAMSVEEVIHNQLNARHSKGNHSGAPSRRTPPQDESGMVAINEDTGFIHRPPKLQGLKSNQRSNNNSRPSSNSSDRGIAIASPKLKTIPINSSHLPNTNTNLSITTPGAKNAPVTEMPRAGKSAGRISPSKSLHRSGASSASSIKSGPMPGEPEYIKITSQLIAGSPTPSNYSQQLSYQSYMYQPGSNTPREELQYPNDIKNDVFSSYADVEFVKENFSHMDFPTKDGGGDFNKNQEGLGNSDNNNNNNEVVGGEEDENNRSILSESPAPTTVAISIPTADELSDRDSLTNSPSRQHQSDEDLSTVQKRERDFKNEQIGQITDLLGGVIEGKHTG